MGKIFKPFWMTCAIQSRDTGRFLFVKHTDSSWRFAAIDHGITIINMIEQITAFFGHEDYSITSFYSKELDKTFHVWVDAEDQIIVPGGLETSWHPLFEFPDNLHRTVDIAVDNPFFLGHIVEPDKDS